MSIFQTVLMTKNLLPKPVAILGILVVGPPVVPKIPGCEETGATLCDDRFGSHFFARFCISLSLPFDSGRNRKKVSVRWARQKKRDHGDRTMYQTSKQCHSFLTYWAGTCFETQLRSYLNITIGQHKYKVKYHYMQQISLS